MKKFTKQLLEEFIMELPMELLALKLGRKLLEIPIELVNLMKLLKLFPVIFLEELLTFL